MNDLGELDHLDDDDLRERFRQERLQAERARIATGVRYPVGHWDAPLKRRESAAKKAERDRELALRQEREELERQRDRARATAERSPLRDCPYRTTPVSEFSVALPRQVVEQVMGSGEWNDDGRPLLDFYLEFAARPVRHRL